MPATASRLDRAVVELGRLGGDGLVILRTFAVPTRLSPVATRRHVAPDPASTSRDVEEDLPAGVARADPEAVDPAAGDELGQRLGQPSEGLADRIGAVALADDDPVGRGRQLEHFARAERPVQRLDRGRVGRPMGDQRICHLAHRGPGPPDRRQP